VAERRARPRRWFWWTLALLLLCFLAWFKVPALAYYWASTRWGQAHAGEHGHTALGLARYQVAIEGLPVQGLSRNASGLSFNPETGTLFTVINRPPQVAELSTEGQLLRLIEIEGLKDPEGISHVKGDRYVISDEHSDSVYWVQIGAGSERLRVTDQPRLRLSIDAVDNASFEGVSWDSGTERLFIAKEKLPLRVLVISGLDVDRRLPSLQLSISEWKSWAAASLFMSDLSSLTLHEPTGNLLLLSDESALVVEYAPDGDPLGILPLWRGFHGLQRKVPQAEGLAIGPDGALYVLSEPNLFYRFEPVDRPR
jgi:uncharacterized protein YjiK